MEDIKLLKRINVLCVEDEIIVRLGLGRYLSRRCKAVYEAENGKDGLERYKDHKPDVVITDIEMPVMNGLEMIDRILEIDGNQAIIITTAYDDNEHKSDRACRNIIKPIDYDELVKAIIKCMKR
ncbi:response regulator receiver protein [Candidatus Magnetobacterium bavaricum]|uniref:Response regulator receiver protein n=1 Tax=Candidatus Magnetobacterium bavaricum TaxID=29290 RepID=A0A0F3H0C4_9BACT|nr:response regulator receiver protein [Candidatus Magnetobacterium bavaricum]